MRHVGPHPGGRVLHADHLMRWRQRQVLRLMHPDAGTGWHVLPCLGVQGEVVHPLDNVREVWAEAAMGFKKIKTILWCDILQVGHLGTASPAAEPLQSIL